MLPYLEKISDKSLLIIWESLDEYDPSEEFAPGTSMDTWAELVYVEISKRHLLSK